MAVAKAFSVQGRVIWALMLREVHTLYGGDRLGYLWAIIQSAFGIGVFWIVRVVMGFKAPHGMSMPAFLITGFAVWSLFSSIVLKSVSAIDGNKTLLTFPQVTPVDLHLARAGVIVATEVVVAVLLLSLSYYLGYEFARPDWLGVMGALFLATGLGLGLGMTLSSLCAWVPVLAKLVPMVFRIMFFLSGVFFSLRGLPYGLREYISWNPALQVIEWMRVSLAPTYPASDVNIPYLCTLVALTITSGLLLERHARRYFAQQY